MSTVQEVARGVRAVAGQVPRGVVSGLDGDLDATRELLAGVLDGSQFRDEVIGQVSAVHASLVQNLAAALTGLERALLDVAADLASENGTDEPAAPTGTTSPMSRKTTELRGTRRERHPDKEMENALRDYERAGWTIEKSKGNHFWLWAPDGMTTDCVASTPSKPVTAVRAMRHKLKKWMDEQTTD